MDMTTQIAAPTETAAEVEAPAAPLPYLDRWLASQRADAEAEIAKFRASLETDPLRALEWGNSAIVAAAWLTVARALIGGRAHGRTLAELRAWALNEALRRAGSVQRSTSSMSNLVSLALQEVWAEAHEKLSLWIHPEDAGEPAEPLPIISALRTVAEAAGTAKRDTSGVAILKAVEAERAELQSGAPFDPAVAMVYGAAADLVAARVGSLPLPVVTVDLTPAEVKWASLHLESLAEAVRIAGAEAWFNGRLPIGCASAEDLLAGSRLAVLLDRDFVTDILKRLDTSVSDGSRGLPASRARAAAAKIRAAISTVDPSLLAVAA